MDKILFYGSMFLVLGIAAWHYFLDIEVADKLYPLVSLLLSTGFFGYARIAKNRGRISSDTSKIYRHKTPRVFNAFLYFFYSISVFLFFYAIYLLVT